MIALIWRYHTSTFNLKTRNGGFTSGGPNIPVKGKLGFNTYMSICVSGIVGTFRHEYAHPLLGDNNFHSGMAGAGNGTYLSDHVGYSLLSSVNSNLNFVNGWDRDRLGWKPDNNQYYISARDINYSEVNGDLEYSPDIQNREFILRDFATYGDAIRIKLPHTKNINNNTRSQYIWIENHQLLPNSVETPPTNNKAKGIRLNIQVGNDSYTSTSNSRTNYISPICSFGNYDFAYSEIDASSKIADYASTYDNKSNPLSGYSLLEAHAVDYKNPINEIHCKEVLTLKKVKKNNETIISNFNNQEMLYPIFDGYQFDVFSTGSKIGISTNPSTATNLTFKTYYRYIGDTPGFYPDPASDDNRYIFLNGLETEVVEEKPNGDIKVRIKWDKFDVDNDVRWCGPIILTDRINLKSNKTILLDQGLTPTRPNNPIVFESENIFASPTTFKARNNSILNLESYSKIEVKNSSSMEFENGSN